MPIKTNQSNSPTDQVQIEPDEIVIQETPTYELDTPQSKNPWYQNKRTLGTIGVSLVLLIILGVVIAVCTKKKKKKEDITPTPEEDLSKLDISYKTNEVLKYSDETTQTTSIKLDGFGTKKQNSIIKGEYLFNVYEVDESKTPKEYKAIAVLLNLIKKRGNKEDNMGGEDVTSLTSGHDKLPLIRFTFNSDGEIGDLETPKEVSNTVAAFVYEFIEKIVPEVTSKSRRLYDAKREIKKEGDYVSMTITSEEGPYGNNEDSKENKKTKVNVKDGKIQEVDFTKDAVINTNNLQQVEFIVNSNFTQETQDEVLSKKRNLVEEIKQYFDSKMKKTSEKVDEQLTNKLKNLLAKVNFKPYTPLSSNDKRILNTFAMKQFNDLSNEEQTRYLQSNINDYYTQPIFLDYPLFRTNYFGAQIGLIARLAFTPQNGLFSTKIFLKQNNEQILLYEKETYSNFGEIIDKIDEVLQLAGYYIVEDIEKKIQVEYDQIETQINEQLNKLYAYMDEFPGFIDIFHQPLEDLLQAIYLASANCYNTVYKTSEKAVNVYDELYNSINSGQNTYLDYLLQTTQSSINDFIQELINKLKSIYSASQLFFPKLKEEVDYQLDLIEKRFDTNFTHFDICTYYDINDRLNEIKSIFYDFESGIKNATIMENAFFNSSIMSSFESIVDPYIKHIEYYSDKMKHNLSVIEGMRRYYGQEIGDTRRTTTITWIDGMRRKIYIMMDKILEKINNLYQQKILALNSDFKGEVEKIKIYAEEILKNGTEFLQYLEDNKLVNYAKNFSIYIEDITSISTIYVSTLQVREKAFKEYIIDALKKKDFDYITPIIETFKNDVQGYIDDIIYETKLKRYSSAIEKCKELQNRIPQLVKRYLNADLASNIKNKYVDDEAFKTMAQQYYDEVLPAFMEYNNTFFEKVFKEHMGSYISRPTEVETKLRTIQNNEEKILEETIEYITTIIITYINNEIKDAYLKTASSFESYLDYFHTQAPKEIYGSSGNYRKLYEDIENYFKDIHKLLTEDTKKIPILYMRKIKDEFSLTKYFEQGEFTITNNILGKLIDEIYIYFDEFICITNEIVCKDGELVNIMSSIDQYQFQLAKLRAAVSYLSTLIPFAKDIINSDLLADLDPNEFLQLYIENFNYNENALISQILELLEFINAETKLFITNYASGIKDKIREIFYKAINKEGLAEAVTKIAQSIFIDPYDYQMALKSYVEGPCGPIARFITLFNEEIIYNTEKSNMKFSFNRDAYNQDYLKINAELVQYYKNEREKFLDEVFVPRDLEQKLYDFIDKAIDDVYQQLKDQVELVCEDTEFVFLNSTFSLVNIIGDTLNDVRNQIKDEIKEEIDNIYNEYLGLLIYYIKGNLDKRFDVIMENLDSQAQSTFSTYSNKSQTSEYVIDALDRENLVPGLRNVLKQFMDKAKDIYNQMTIALSLNQLQDDELKDFDLIIGAVGVIDGIKNAFADFMEKARMRLTQEILIFESNINVYFVKGFNKTIESFLSTTGKDYLDAIIESDYLTNVVSKFRDMMIFVNNTYDYMNALLDDVYLKQISKLISKRVEEIYGYVRDEIKDVIETQIDVIISNKFEIFKNAILASIPNYFLTRLTEMIKSDYFVNTLYNEKVYKLIPQNYTDGFRANLTQYLHSKLTTDNLKDQYKNTVNSDFNDVVQILTNYHVLMGKRASEASHTYSNAAMNTMIVKYLEWSEEVITFDILYYLEVDENKIDKIKEFFEKEIIPSLKDISDGYDIERGIQIRNLQKVLEDYKIVDFLKEVKKRLADMKFETNIEEINKKTKEIMDNLYNKVKAMFDNIAPKLKAKFNEPLSGFKKIEKTRNLRNLLTYDLRQINEQLSITQQRYERFKESVLKNDNLIAVAAQVGAFKGKILNSAEHLIDYVYSYKVLISDFIDPSQVTEAIESKASEVKIFLMDYTMDLSKNVYDTIGIIKSRVTNGWVTIKKEIDSSISTTLDDVFRTLFSQLKEFSDIVNEKLEFNSPFEYYVFDEKDQVVVKVNILLKSINLKNVFSIKPYNTFYFHSSITTDAYLNAQISLTIDETMRVLDDGTVGGGRIEMEVKHVLDNKSVEVKSTVKTDNTKYISYYQEFEYNTFNWVTKQKLDQETRLDSSTSFVKAFQNGLVKISQFLTQT